ncbi:MAG: DUF952 domain-containing protein [Acidimicrobiia bacterium]|jgi:uncharacterized protein (DUF952 family)
MAKPIHHLADRGDWELRTDVYRASSLESEGFIHCSTRDQLADVARRHFGDHTDLVVLTIDPEALDVKVVFEDLYDLGEEYPHVYGAVNIGAVMSALPYLDHLEEGMWRETRADAEWMDHVLHPDFVEVGRSGRTYDRTQAIETTDYPYDYELPLQSLETELIGEDIALVRYVSRESLDGETSPAHRTSLWIHTDTGWRLRFHQGTPIT